MPDENKTPPKSPPPPPPPPPPASTSPPRPSGQRVASKSPNPYLQHQKQLNSPPAGKSPVAKAHQRTKANKKRRWAAEYRRLALQKRQANKQVVGEQQEQQQLAAGRPPQPPPGQKNVAGHSGSSGRRPAPSTLWKSPIKSPQRRPLAARDQNVPAPIERQQIKSISSQKADNQLAATAAAAGRLVPAAKKSVTLETIKEPTTPTGAQTTAAAAGAAASTTPAKEPIAYSPSTAFAYYNSKTPESILNCHRLTRDGRKVPSQYRTLAQMASSPSQLSLRSISEYYNIPNSRFKTINDVFRYRGYRKMNKIDEGAFGVVSKANRFSDSMICAVKEVDLSRKRHKRIEEMKRELFVLQKIDSPLIVKLIEHFIVGQTLVIIMEYCAGSNLTAYLKESPINEDEAQMLFKQMAASIKILHRKGIAHRDVKLNNFLLDNTRKLVKVADFGLSVVSYRRAHGIIMAKTYCGTEPYMAPEIMRRNSMGVRCYNPLYADVWSLGVCLFAMLTRTFPFKMNLSQRSLYKAQSTRRWRFPKSLRDSLSEDLKDLIWHMLDPEPERRISINGIVAHPWLNPNDAVDLSHDES